MKRLKHSLEKGLKEERMIKPACVALLNKKQSKYIQAVLGTELHFLDYWTEKATQEATGEDKARVSW